MRARSCPRILSSNVAINRGADSGGDVVSNREGVAGWKLKERPVYLIWFVGQTGKVSVGGVWENFRRETFFGEGKTAKLSEFRDGTFPKLA